MLDDAVLNQILDAAPRLHTGVVGDLFLDRYFDLDAALTEPSLETGLDALQVVKIRSNPGAAGTVLNNLSALGVGRVSILSVIGEDGEAFELRRELERRQVALDYLLTTADRLTPTYLKPMLRETDRPARELNRFDIKNRTPLPKTIERRIIDSLPKLLDQVHALVVVDQVSEPECGVVTTAVRERLAELGEAHAGKLILADSRQRIGLFRKVSLKPNESECRVAVPSALSLEECIRALARQAQRTVFCTRGEQGTLVFDPRNEREGSVAVRGYPVEGPIDVVGAGDSVNAAIACASAAGASASQAAAFGNLVASVTVQQLGVTGTASPDQVRQRWREVASRLTP